MTASPANCSGRCTRRARRPEGRHGEAALLPHPNYGTLFRQNVGWPDGQTSDYTISYKDGSRLHAQCFGIRNGFVRVRLHWDKFDPDQGLLNFVLHGLLETPVGPAMVGVLVVARSTTPPAQSQP